MVMGPRWLLSLKRSRGFALIELMVALAITGVIGAVISVTVIQMMTVQASTQNRVDAVKQVESALHYINEDIQMAFPGQSSVNNSSNLFALTSLSSSVAIGAHSVTVASASGFVAPGTVVVGSGSGSETLAYTAIAGNTLTTAAATKAHNSGDPVANAMTLKWLDNTGLIHTVSYSLLNVSNVKYLQRRETIGAGQAAVTSLADSIDSATSFYTFDGHVLSVTLSATVSGFRSATESRTLVVQLRPTL
jgi:prepilin-type N-terminal cleavage/methylation domain-containing protein